MLHELPAQFSRKAKEIDELLGEDVVRTDVKPRLIPGFVFLVTGPGHFPETTVSNHTQLVIVVENDATMPGHAEVFRQQIAGKDIAQCQVPNCLSIVSNCATHGQLVGFLQIEIQRPHTPFDVAMFDDEIVTICTTGAARSGFQFLQ